MQTYSLSILSVSRHASPIFGSAGYICTVSSRALLALLFVFRMEGREGAGESGVGAEDCRFLQRIGVTRQKGPYQIVCTMCIENFLLSVLPFSVCD